MANPSTSDLPRKFVEVIGAAYGQRGWDWIERELPRTIAEIETLWSVRVGAPFDNLSYHFVAPCWSTTDGSAVVKIGISEPDSPMRNEAAMLTAYRGIGAIKVLRTVPDKFATLLEHARGIRSGVTNAALVDEALAALLARHRAADVDASYAAYDEHPIDEPDEWGDLASFRRAAAAS